MRRETMKKIISITLLILIASILITGCSNQKEETKEVVGGWLKTYTRESNLTEEEKIMFEEAMNTYKELKLEPVTLIGTQIVSGTNYMFLCKGTTISNRPVSNWKMVIVYKDLQGKSTITSVKDFNLDEYAGNNKASKETELVGGWEASKKEESIDISEITQNYFKEATESIQDMTYTPITILGTQTVAGMNYAILSLGKKDETYSINVLTMYVNLDGDSEITYTSVIDMAEFNGQN